MAHFYSSLPDSLGALTHQEAVKRYIEERNVPRQGLAGLSTEELNSHPVPGTWSIQQILIHLMDTDLIACYRMKRIIAEDRPELDLYDETGRFLRGPARKRRGPREPLHSPRGASGGPSRKTPSQWAKKKTAAPGHPRVPRATVGGVSGCVGSRIRSSRNRSRYTAASPPVVAVALSHQSGP